MNALQVSQCARCALKPAVTTACVILSPDPAQLQSKWAQSVGTCPQKTTRMTAFEDEAPSSQHIPQVVDTATEHVNPLHRAALLDQVCTTRKLTDPQRVTSRIKLRQSEECIARRSDASFHRPKCWMRSSGKEERVCIPSPRARHHVSPQQRCSTS